MGCEHSNLPISPVNYRPKIKVPVIYESQAIENEAKLTKSSTYSLTGKFQLSKPFSTNEICEFCGSSGPDFLLCCGHSLHRKCAILLYQQHERCGCGHDYLDEIEEFMFSDGGNAQVQQVQEIEQCPICFNAISGEDLHILQCGHCIHAQCYQQLRKFSDKCPLCRKNL